MIVIYHNINEYSFFGVNKRKIHLSSCSVIQEESMNLVGAASMSKKPGKNNKRIIKT